jgi:hypothetical protein
MYFISCTGVLKFQYHFRRIGDVEYVFAPEASFLDQNADNPNRYTKSPPPFYNKSGHYIHLFHTSRIVFRATMASRFLALGIRQTSRQLTGLGVRRWFASYPPHEVVGMPSLSPVSTNKLGSWCEPRRMCRISSGSFVAI